MELYARLSQSVPTGPSTSEPPEEHPQSGGLGLCTFTGSPDVLYLAHGRDSIWGIRSLLSSLGSWIASPMCLSLLIEPLMQPILGNRLPNTV